MRGLLPMSSTCGVAKQATSRPARGWRGGWQPGQEGHAKHCRALFCVATANVLGLSLRGGVL